MRQPKDMVDRVLVRHDEGFQVNYEQQGWLVAELRALREASERPRPHAHLWAVDKQDHSQIVCTVPGCKAWRERND